MNIKRYREELNLSQTDLSKLVGITSNAICQYEQGKRMPNVYILKKLAEVLKCSIEDLLENEKG